MWYDILVVCILLFFLAKGAAKGLVWQLAGIAGILLCMTFASTASKVIGPHINLAPPANQWAVMFITYLLASFVAFGFARTLNSWIEKMEFKEYNRHLGAIFGLVKGALLVLLMTFMIVTFSEKSRNLIKDSRAAHIAAKVIHQIEPLVPDKMSQAVGRYIQMFEATGFAHTPPDEFTPEEKIIDQYPTEIDGLTQLGQPAPFETGNPQTRTPATLPPSDLYNDLLGVIGKAATDKLTTELGGASPRTKAQLESTITSALQSADRQTLLDLQQRIRNSERNQEPLLQNVGDWAYENLENVLQPAVPANSGTRQPAPVDQPNVANTPTAPRITSPVAPTGPRTMLDDIVAAKTQFASLQSKLKQEYENTLQGLPKNISAAVITDWHGDLTNSPTDTDPETDSTTPIEARIIRQLRSARISESKLPAVLQKRLADFRLTAHGAETIR
ncbi:MAG: CvpA family protein [Planctomycetota bacterium]|nr:MAG: CvpA family protein [Planctomycetota bacterium]